MPQPPLTITLARYDEDVAVDLEVTFLAEDDPRPPEHLFGTDAAPAPATAAATARATSASADGASAALAVIRAAAAALGARVLGDGGAVHVLGGVPLRAVVGVGKRAEITLDTLRRAAAQAIGCATDLHRASLAISLPADVLSSVATDVAVQVVAEGALLAAHARTARSTLTPKPDAARPPTRCVLRLATPETGPPSAAASARAGPAPAARPDGPAPPSAPTGPAPPSAPTGPAPPAAATAENPSGPLPGARPDGERAPPRDAHQASLARAEAHAAAVLLARELADMPANRLSPVELAERAAQAVQPLGVAAEVLVSADLERLGAGLLLAVGAGSARPPALGVLRYRPPTAAHHVAVVGKGITFDAGGINVKPAKGMGDMIHDKAGAAAAAGIILGAAQLRLPIAVTALLACAENLPSGAAYRPGDVLLGMDGATVEVVDTDAEGRLVLADALTYAVRLSEPRPVDVIVDLATLTGSIVSALGNEAAGLFANHEGLAASMLAAAEAAGEPLWRMPILAGHRAQLKSERADRKQCGERGGDCAIAAAFLEMYVDRRPWLHLDIAGVAYNEGSPEWPPYHPKSGASGAGVRTVLQFLEALCAATPAAAAAAAGP